MQPVYTQYLIFINAHQQHTHKNKCIEEKEKKNNKMRPRCCVSIKFM